MALAVKLLEDMTREGIGVNKVETSEWQRMANREAKKGQGKKILPGGKKILVLKKERRMVVMKMEQRVLETKQDWKEIRSRYRNLQKKLQKSCQSESERNKLKRTLPPINLAGDPHRIV